MLKIGIIGYGDRISGIVEKLVDSGKVEVAAITDVDYEGVKKRAEVNKLKNNFRFYNDADEMLKNEQLHGVCIGTRCSSHTQYAISAAKYKLPMFLEKPVSTTYEDLEKLKKIIDVSDNVVVSFPLRRARIVTYVKEIIDSGKIGKVAHVQAYNNVPYGRGYYHKWYRNEKETGGLFLQKATHDLDYINYILGEIKPECICAMKSKQVFKGDKPAGLLCKNCSETKICPESPENVSKINDGYKIGEFCCFAVDTGNEDSGSLITQYDNGMHVVYSQNFVARNGAAKRGARFIGYYGTVEFDFYTGIVTLYHHTENITETHKFESSAQSHFGGDQYLTDNFIDVMNGTEKSKSNLKEGILSAEMCLAAKISSTEHKFVYIESGCK